MKIAITGNIGSGKSEAIKFLLSIGHKCISSDQIIKILYQNDKSRSYILKRIGVTNKNYKEEIIKRLIDPVFNKNLKKVSDKEAEEAFKTILKWMGEDPNREGLLETPKRVVKAFKEYFKGYSEDPKSILEKTFGDVEGYDDMVVQKNISVQSHCEHHMAPIIGIAHVAYIPKERVVGLSKLARVVEVFSKRLQTQERLTMQIATTLMESLDAKGVAVTIDSTHQCMTMRGIKKEQATTVTNYYMGQFKDDLSYQNRYLRFIAK